jgi:ABC-type glycerol-3-phosphate transport system substrate-binding protein
LEETIAMSKSRSAPRALTALLGVVAIVAAACGGSAASTAPSTAPSEAAAPSVAITPEPTPLLTPEPIDASVPGPNGGQIIRWFVGLGAGGQPQQIQVQKDFVTAFNNDPANKDKAYISLEILDNNVAANILKTQIAAGNAPDIIGPVGVEGLNLFIDQVADLQPLIDSTGYDMSKYPEALADFFKIGKDGATIGVPFGTYPSFLWYNKKLFDEAKLPYPPTEVGAMYEGKPWDMAAVRETATTPRARTSIPPTSSSGASIPSGPTTLRRPRRRCSAPARSSPRTARRPRSRTPCEPASTGSTTASGRTTSSPTRTRSTATCWPRATRSSRATWP